ncbi:unnamed protein product [Parnassius apollo]|uniref:(apollo) hypothetical protein n=1 Tax=Parnassius apollo TaxID=110799 RepID=A0A8S3W8W1_PARAO|nr:unnamed protein product [Parnassius apollo]
MEYKRTRKGPLPGGRLGASGSGAGAGLDNMRTASRVRGPARPPSSSSHSSSPLACLVSAGSSQAKQSTPATGGDACTINMNINALRDYFRAKEGEVGGFPYRARVHRLFAELEPSITVTEQNLVDPVWYILRSNIFDGAENSTGYDVRLFPH